MQTIINNITKYFKKDTAKNQSESPSVDDVKLTKISTRQKYQFGKVLSFAFDDSSIQMSAVVHYGKSFKILEVRKDYFTSSQITKSGYKTLILSAISEFKQKHFDRFTKIVLTLSGEETLYRTFLMPDLKSKELDTAVRFEVRKLIPFPIEECIFDYRAIQKVTNQDKTQIKLSLHAATYENIQKHMQPFEELGITVDRIYHSQDTIGQLLRLLKDFSNDNSYTLINIGHKATEISFYNGCSLEFSRSSGLSSEMLGGKGNSTIRYEYFAESIANEIQNSLDYYAGQFTTGYNNKLLVYGDFAYSDELLDILNEKLDITLVRFPIDDLKIAFSKENITESYPVSLSVMATAVNYSVLPNLLPPKQKTIRQQALTNNYVKLGVGFVVLILAISWMYMYSSIQTSEGNLLIASKQVEVFQESKAFHTYNLIKRDISLDQSYIELAKQAPSYMHLNLKELSRLIPENIKLFHLDYNPYNELHNYYIQGTVRSIDIPPEITLAEFVELLNGSPFYDDVQIVRHVKKKNKYSFEIEFQIKMRGNV